ncbi:MAG: hypothetical protein Q4D66_01260 [Bacteroidales bacterium]|nr:hypothetical protein [Bacteroidales bacterium]
MKMHLFLGFALAGTALLGSSCSSKLDALTADNFVVTPSPLEAMGNQVPVTINGRFPEKYMKKKAVVTVTPELRYAGQTAMGQSATFQGEKVVGNDQTIAYKVGGNYVMKSSFQYVPDMAASELYLTFNARVGKKQVKIPAVKVANGVVATSQLVYQTAASASTATAADGFQQQINRQQQAQIKYLINQARVRTSQLNTTTVKDFVKVLRDIKADQKGLALDNIEISAYASPEGALNFNTKLAEGREKSAAQYVGQQLKKTKISTNVDTKYTAEDWEGFQELVSQSNIQDKEVILRVLSMYKDPQEREQQIRNLSLAFRELANEVLPELRRARLTINYRLIGRTNEEIQQQLKAEPGKLSIEEILYAATLTQDLNERKSIFELATQIYPNDRRAYNGLAQVAYAQGNLAAAKAALAQAGNSVEAQANAALIALREGQLDQAESLLGKALTAPNYNEVLGNLQIARGQYAQAAQSLSGIKTNSAALAQLLNKDYNGALNTLAAVARPDAQTDYLSAIVAARTGQFDTAVQALRKAIAKDSTLAKRAASDLEFVKLASNAAFRTLLK